MTAPARPLTDRQRQVLSLLANGLTHRQAARQLGVSKTALNDRLREATRKLGAVTTPHAVLLACQAGILDGRPRRHGDHAGYEAHRKRGEDPKQCELCSAGEREHRNRYAAARRRQAAPEGP